MSIILTLSGRDREIWAAGPHGLFRLEAGGLRAAPQPQERLACCLALHDRLLVGGAPHGVAYLHEDGEQWQAAWMDNCDAAVLALAPAPDFAESGVLLAGSEGDGILRSTDRGHRFTPMNYGLRSYTVLALTWAPATPADAVWNQREIVFAGTEEGLYRSPSGGRGWKRAECPTTPYQTIAVAPDFHTSGIVLAGTEESGLWRSADGGLSFKQVAKAPNQVNALAATSAGWLLADHQQMWHSADSQSWEPIAGSVPALVITEMAQGILVGAEDGVVRLDSKSFGVLERYQAPVPA